MFGHDISYLFMLRRTAVLVAEYLHTWIHLCDIWLKNQIYLCHWTCCMILSKFPITISIHNTQFKRIRISNYILIYLFFQRQWQVTHLTESFVLIEVPISHRCSLSGMIYVFHSVGSVYSVCRTVWWWKFRYSITTCFNCPLPYLLLFFCS